MTVEEFLVCEPGEKKAELVRGELRVSPPAGAPHRFAGANLVTRLILHVEPRKLGRVIGDGFGYHLVQLPHTVRVPDASFVCAERWPSEIESGLLKIAPDIAIEVLSPRDTASALQERLGDYFEAGIRLVWVLDPVRRTVTVVAKNAPLKVLHEADTLTGGDVLPDFSCAVTELFDGILRNLRRAKRG